MKVVNKRRAAKIVARADRLATGSDHLCKKNGGKENEIEIKD